MLCSSPLFLFVQGAFLYVGVFDDPTVCSYKGRNPVMNLHERVLNVLSCKFVDEVVIGAPFQITPDLLKTFNVAVVARAESDAAHTEKAHRRRVETHATTSSACSLPLSSLCSPLLVPVQSFGVVAPHLGS